MLKTLQNAWRIPELRKKLMFTLLILLLYRIGNVIPVPFVDTAAMAHYFDQTLSSTVLGLLQRHVRLRLLSGVRTGSGHPALH